MCKITTSSEKKQRLSLPRIPYHQYYVGKIKYRTAKRCNWNLPKY